MDIKPLVLMSGIGIVGYAVFHGHKVGEDCWICPYKGVVFLGSSVGLGVMLAVSEKD